MKELFGDGCFDFDDLRIVNTYQLKTNYEYVVNILKNKKYVIIYWWKFHWMVSPICVNYLTVSDYDYWCNCFGGWSLYLRLYNNNMKSRVTLEKIKLESIYSLT